MVLLVSYDLNDHERPSSYEAVAELITQRAISYRRPLYSQWLVETSESPQAWSNAIQTAADSNDRWLIVRVVAPYWGVLDREIWPWLEARL